MKLEHVGLNVSDPIAMGRWYEQHLGMEIASRVEGPPHTHFLRDSSGTMMLEVYNHPVDQVPAYSRMDPLIVHVAFACDDPQGKSEELVAAGAAVVSEARLADGSLILTLRDPWGLAIQLCRRRTPLLRSG